MEYENEPATSEVGYKGSIDFREEPVFNAGKAGGGNIQSGWE